MSRHVSGTEPYTSAYVTSEHALRGLGECLRMDLIDERNIHVCTVLPASIDTPIFQHAANYTGRAVKPIEPVYPAEAVGAAIVRLVGNPRREERRDPQATSSNRCARGAGSAVAGGRNGLGPCALSPHRWQAYSARSPSRRV